jgi:tetratricopeptide (TPR) repeat protein
MKAPEALAAGLAYERAGVLDRALEQYQAVLDATDDPRLVSSALIRVSHARRVLCAWEEGLQAAERAARIAADAGLTKQHGEAINAEAAIYHTRGDFRRAEAAYARIPEITRDPRVCGMAWQNLGAAAAMQGRLSLAETRFSEAYESFREAEDASGEAHVLNSYTALAVDREDWQVAEERGRLAIEAAARVGDLDLLAIARYNYAEALCGLGRFPEAEEEAAAALGYFQAAGNRLRRAHSLRTLGLINEKQHDWATARRFYERALDVVREIGAAAETADLARRLDGLPSA